MVTGLEFIIIAAVLVAIWMTTRKPKNFPPGPPRWPIFGYLRVFTYRECGKHLVSVLQKKYGEVAGFYVLNIPVVLISGNEAIREAFLREDLTGRPTFTNIYSNAKSKDRGIFLTSGDVWKFQRRFTLHHLRDLGFGKRSIEGMVYEDIQDVFDAIEELSGGHRNGFPYPVNFASLLKGATIEGLWHLITGKRHNNRDNEFNELIISIQSMMSSNPQETVLHSFFPWLAKILKPVCGTNKFESGLIKMDKYMQKVIDSHKAAIDYDHPRDLMDVYICEIKKQKDNLNKIFNELQLKQLCAELLMAGSETTSSTMTFAILYMILYPEVQIKVQQEIDEVVGKDRLPSLNDRARLPYVEATIEEVFRLSSIIPNCFPHAPFTTENYITFRGYHIPKDAGILLNLHDLHHDPKIWKYPETLIPERFLQENGKDIHHGVIYPFGFGKRRCPAETFVRDHIFLFFTAILQRYNLKVPDGQPQPSQEPDGMNTLYPKPFTVKVQQRI